MHALVYKSTGSWYQLKTAEGDFVQARIKGKLKIDDITSTNPVAVGDVVDIEPSMDAENTFNITGIQDRKNYVNRRSPSNRRLHHIIAANLDQSVLVATLREPRTSQGFVDRFLVTCEAYHVPALVVLNKVDLYRTKEQETAGAWIEMYEQIGYPVLLTSSAERTGLGDLQARLQDKTTLFSGHSGVGKSSLINAMMPDLALRTKEVSGWSGKGMHTTTFAEMFDLPFGGRIIDTPGMREFGIVDISRQELSHYFPEMRDRLHDCQFNNCLHTDEPGCAVKAAVESGEIALERYLSYGTILESIEAESW
jgi:ribosome biogenesis GTPase